MLAFMICFTDYIDALGKQKIGCSMSPSPNTTLSQLVMN